MKYLALAFCCLLGVLAVHGEAGEADIHKAIAKGDLEGVKEALEWGDNINVKHTGNNQTPMMHAVLNGNNDIVGI